MSDERTRRSERPRPMGTTAFFDCGAASGGTARAGRDGGGADSVVGEVLATPDHRDAGAFRGLDDRTVVLRGAGRASRPRQGPAAAHPQGRGPAAARVREAASDGARPVSGSQELEL